MNEGVIGGRSAWVAEVGNLPRAQLSQETVGLVEAQEQGLPI